MPRFSLTDLDESRGVITGDEARHLLRVHRIRSGEKLNVSWQGAPYLAVVTGLLPDRVEVDVLEVTSAVEPLVAVQLMPAMLKGDKMELVIQKAVELGVSSLLPVHCQRSIVPLSKAVDRVDRYRKIAGEAAKQSGRTSTPYVEPAEGFSAALANARDGLRLIAHEAGGEDLWKTLTDNHGALSVTLAVGPEGGFTSEEVAEALSAGFVPVGLGPRILRAETASLALLSIIMHHLGDMR
ncbi:MAG TPA: RsmE family RNA methyltransferase [Bacillota bacterium]|nr:RsmE family RNA methyltransferase [Bacillota bacterium]